MAAMMARLIGDLMPILVILAVVMVGLSVFSGKLGNDPNFKAHPIMTAAEIAFWRILCKVVAPWHIAPQVSMGALLAVGGNSNASDRRSARNKFDRKIVDFVLLDDDGDVHLLIELDDRSHRPERDVKRDRMTASAGYKTFRVTGRLKHDADALRTALRAAL